MTPERRRPQPDSVARRQLVRIRELGIVPASALDLHRTAALAEVAEAMHQPERAEALWIDVAACALARAELAGPPPDEAANDQPA